MIEGDFYIGDPAAQMDDWQLQDRDDNCAVAAETSIINQFITDDISLNDANYISASNGWWEPGMGTSPDDIGNMMDLYNIPNHTVMNATVEQLAGELAQGHGVIVGVNSSELWGSEEGLLNDLMDFLREQFGWDFEGADHAVTVTGIDMSNPEEPMVIINDSGSPDGASAMYPLDQFTGAWENSGFYYTATDVPIPSETPSILEGGFDPNDVFGFGIDLGDIIGVGTTIVTGDPVAGGAVNTLIDMFTEGDWAQVLQS